MEIRSSMQHTGRVINSSCLPSNTNKSTKSPQPAYRAISFNSNHSFCFIVLLLHSAWLFLACPFAVCNVCTGFFSVRLNRFKCVFSLFFDVFTCKWFVYLRFVCTPPRMSRKRKISDVNCNQMVLLSAGQVIAISDQFSFHFIFSWSAKWIWLVAFDGSSLYFVIQKLFRKV